MAKKTPNERAIALVKKHTGQDVQPYEYGWYFAHNGYVVSWHLQDGEPLCIKVRHEDDHDDSQTDYFAGYFVESVQAAVKAVTRLAGFWRDDLNETVFNVVLTWAKGNGFRRVARFDLGRYVCVNPTGRAYYERNANRDWHAEDGSPEALALAERFIAGDLPAEILLDWLTERHESLAALMLLPAAVRGKGRGEA